MSAKLEYGQVRSFNHLPQMLYGLVRATNGEMVPFRWNGFRLLELNGPSDFAFYSGARQHPPRRVQVGERIYFERESYGQGRVRVRAWCFKENHDLALKILTERSREQALEYLKATGQLGALVERAYLTEIGLTGHVSTSERHHAQERSVAPLQAFELELVRPYIEREKAHRQDIFRQVMIEELGEDPYQDDL